MAASVQAGRTRPSATYTFLNTLLLPFLLVLAGMVLLSLGQGRFGAWQGQYGADFRFHTELWVQRVGLVALSGLAFGLAAWFPRTPFSYRWGRVALLGILPLAMLVHFAVLWGYALPHHWNVPYPLDRQFFYFAIGPQFVLATLLGVSVASVFVPSERSKLERHN